MAENTGGAPDPGPDDCYNRTTQTCNRKHPGKTMGDADYRACINAGLDWCDGNEALGGFQVPAFDKRGRLVKANIFDKAVRLLHG